MSANRLESEWCGRRAVECRLLVEQNVGYRGEELTGAVLLRGRPIPEHERKDSVRFSVELRHRQEHPWIVPRPSSAARPWRPGEIAALGPGEERSFPFALFIRNDALAHPGSLVVRVHSAKWPHRRLAQALIPIRIGPERSAEELLVEVANLAEARAQAWNASGSSGMVRARFWPTRAGARFRYLTLVVKVSGGRAKGTLEVAKTEGDLTAYQVDLRLADRREYREVLWNCLAQHLDLSGQLPIPAVDYAGDVEYLPLPAGRPDQ